MSKVTPKLADTGSAVTTDPRVSSDTIDPLSGHHSIAHLGSPPGGEEEEGLGVVGRTFVSHRIPGIWGQSGHLGSESDWKWNIPNHPKCVCCFRKICKDRTLRILERILETIGSLRAKLGDFHVTDSLKNCHSKTFSNLYFCFHLVSATILFQCLHWFSVHVIPGDFQKFPSESATQCPVLSMFLGPGSPNPQSLCVQDNNGQFDHILAD